MQPYMEKPVKLWAFCILLETKKPRLGAGASGDDTDLHGRVVTGNIALRWKTALSLG